MRLTPESLPLQLKKEYLSCYLLYGNETFLVEESARLLRQTFTETLKGDIETIILDTVNATSISQLCQTLQSGSLFSTIRLFDIRFLSNVATKDIAIIESILLAADKTTYFLLQFGSLTRTQQQTSWFLAADKKGAVIAHWPLVTHAFSKWLDSRLKAKQVSLLENERALLIAQTEGNCLAAAQEIDRLALMGQTDSASVSCLAQQTQFDVFDLCEAALQQNSSRVAHILDALKRHSTPLPLMIWALSQTLRVLAQCANTPNERERQTIFQRASVKPSVQVLYLNRLKHNLPSCQALLSELFLIDKALKSHDAKDVWHRLVKCFFGLSGTVQIEI